ncbi:hypothetical protein [Paraflavitalea pollutisoli]|uniref:hypothetical protein n=1 Tax=Paraflavitalea pollutisoli TaxID=3034143 RepID=UPI0023ED59DD|nr:hypothetical protein [Paraflavitalea sp. H1-2-19X]
MEPVSIILLVAVVVGYFAFYRPVFLLKPARQRKELIAKFEKVAALNRHLIPEIRQFAEQYNLLDQPFMNQATFRKKIVELEDAREEVLAEENLFLVRARNPRNFDLQLLNSSLDDQLIYHKKIQKALEQYKATNGLQ